MARRNLRKEVEALAGKLPELTDKQRAWAYEHALKKTGYYSKNKVWCNWCGHEFEKPGSSELIVTVAGDTAVCPKCGAELTLMASRKKKDLEKWYFDIYTTCGGWQVFRHFIVERRAVANKYCDMCCQEVCQNWIDEQGHEVVMARSVLPDPRMYDLWNFNTPISYKSKRYGSYMKYYLTNRYEIFAEYIYPVRKWLPVVKRNGFKGDFWDITPSELIKLLLTDHDAEWLMKTGQKSLLQYKVKRYYKEGCLPYRHAVKVAIRAGYVVKDAEIWYDYLDLLAYFGKDTHNAWYVCPKNLKAEHDRLMKKKADAEAKKEQERAMAEMKGWENMYSAAKGAFFGLIFGDGNVTVSVIGSVAEVAEEGKAMHHCVFTNRYFLKRDSLLLSARNAEGKRMETVEVDLKSMKVLQSRGVCNENSELHDEIVALVQANLWMIAERMKGVRV